MLHYQKLQYYSNIYTTIIWEISQNHFTVIFKIFVDEHLMMIIFYLYVTFKRKNKMFRIVCT